MYFPLPIYGFSISKHNYADSFYLLFCSFAISLVTPSFLPYFLKRMLFPLHHLRQTSEALSRKNRKLPKKYLKIGLFNKFLDTLNPTFSCMDLGVFSRIFAPVRGDFSPPHILACLSRFWETVIIWCSFTDTFWPLFFGFLLYFWKITNDSLVF